MLSEAIAESSAAYREVCMEQISMGDILDQTVKRKATRADCHRSHAIDRKAPLTVVRDTLGHSNIAVTNEYAKARPEQSSAPYLPL